jgi:hypothetical protein
MKINYTLPVTKRPEFFENLTVSQEVNINFSNIEKKNIINTIQKLSIEQQRQIFFILQKYLNEEKSINTYEMPNTQFTHLNKSSQIINSDLQGIKNNINPNLTSISSKNDKWYTKNQNGIFINLSSINNSILKDILIFINECKLKKDKLKVLEKEIQSVENKEICYKIIYEENNEVEDFDYLYNNIDKEVLNSINDNIKKKFLKKNNLQTKFINATKKYIKSFNYDLASISKSEKKNDDSLNYFLNYEKYIIGPPEAG